MSLWINHPMLDRLTHERLINWGRCVRSGMGTSAGRCYSIEGLYDRTSDDELPRDSEGEEARRRPSIPPDPHDGAVIERTVCAPSFPHTERELLRLHYVVRVRSERTCRRLGIRFLDYDERVARAVLVVRNRLETRAS